MAASNTRKRKTAWIIEIKNQQKKVRLNLPRIKKIASKILKLSKVSGAHLSIAFISNQKIKILNKQYLRHDYPTDVISFDFSEKKQRVKYLNGEILVSAEMAAQNARTFGTNAEQQIILYILHGTLHLLGYNDHTPNEIKQMRKTEEKLMSALKIR